MIRVKLKLYTYHSFLVIPFVVLFLLAHNQEITRVEMTYRTLIIGAVFSTALYLLTQLIMKNRLKTGVFVTLVLFGLFQYGVIYEMLESLYYKGLWPFKNIHRYLTVFYFLLVVLFFTLINRTKKELLQLNYFLNLLVVVLILFNLIKIGFGNFQKKNYPLPIAELRTNLPIFNDKNNLPNIYYIILDGYANNLVLEKYYHFKNSHFTRFLKNNAFTICDSAYSNYYYTAGSLAATLNFNYLHGSKNETELIRDNNLFYILKNNKYKICHIKSGYSVTGFFLRADTTILIDGPNEFEKSLLKHTILRLDDLIGIFAYKRLNSQFNKMIELVEIKNTPKFCFLHIVAPHPPYVFDRVGNHRAKHQFAENSWEPKEFYIDQLIYVNTQIEKLISKILKSDEQATIIIQSDHGPWINGTADEVFESRSRILYAYYSKKDLLIPQKSSSVNTFRYLLNGLFDCKMALLKDSAAGKEALFNNPIFIKKVTKK